MFSHWLQSLQMPWRISSGGSLRIDGLLIVPSQYLLHDFIHRTLNEGDKGQWTDHLNKLAETMDHLEEVSIFSVSMCQ